MMLSSSAVDRVLGIQTGNHGDTHRPWRLLGNLRLAHLHYRVCLDLVLGQQPAEVQWKPVGGQVGFESLRGV
jgi:hypothetical protein